MSTERKFNESQLVNIVHKALSLKRFDEERKDVILKLENIKNARKEVMDKNKFSIEEIYNVGNEFVENEYIDNAVKILYPSREQLIGDLEEIGTKDSPSIIKNKRWKNQLVYVHKILDRLNEYCPENNHFYSYKNGVGFFEQTREDDHWKVFNLYKEKQKGFFKILSSSKLGQIDFYFRKIKLFAPELLISSKDILDKLSKDTKVTRDSHWYGWEITQDFVL